MEEIKSKTEKAPEDTVTGSFDLITIKCEMISSSVKRIKDGVGGYIEKAAEKLCKAEKKEELILDRWTANSAWLTSIGCEMSWLVQDIGGIGKIYVKPEKVLNAPCLTEQQETPNLIGILTDSQVAVYAMLENCRTLARLVYGYGAAVDNAEEEKHVMPDTVMGLLQLIDSELDECCKIIFEVEFVVTGTR